MRLIGRGARTEVYLAHPMQEAGRTGRGEGAGNVAVKIVPPSERSRGDAEALALQSVASEHVVGLRDVASLADGSLCIVQSLAARGTAAGLLTRRGGLTPGEIVTLVASILRGLGDMHEAGIAHGALDLTHVLIDATGRPVLGGPGLRVPARRRPAGSSRTRAAATPWSRTSSGPPGSSPRCAIPSAPADRPPMIAGASGSTSSTRP
ncbi:protein kinase domain-containing protein [Clavibacter zhangzhiyongii]|uniref:protein kinase domain-containing protein n=1 Tax=Clavibacter zhangzhiyongii TaxID=2768071 RepID=UPI0039E1109E